LHTCGSNTLNDISAALSAAISQHIAKGLPGLYTFHEIDNAIFIDPTQVLDSDGVMASSPSILGTPLIIPFKERTEFETLETVLAEVARQAGVRIGAGMGPWGWLTESKLMFGASGEPARSVILRLFAASNLKRSYRLFYDPGLKLYGSM